MTNNRHGKVFYGPVQHRPFKEHRRCFQCGKLGHIVAKCPSKDPHENIDSDFTLAIPEMQDGFENIWILDSGSSRHLVGNEDWLIDCEDAVGRYVQPGGKPLNITKRGSVTLLMKALGKQRIVTITDVYYAHGLKHKLLSYGFVDMKGFILTCVVHNVY